MVYGRRLHDRRHRPCRMGAQPDRLLGAPRHCRLRRISKRRSLAEPRAGATRGPEGIDHSRAGMSGYYLLLAFAVLSPLPTTEAATATAPVTAPVAVLVTLRMTRLAIDGLADALFAGFADLAFDFAAAGFTVFGAALPNAFLASFDRAATVPAPVFDCVAFPFAGAAFFALVAIALFLLAGCGAPMSNRPRARHVPNGDAPHGEQRTAAPLVPVCRLGSCI